MVISCNVIAKVTEMKPFPQQLLHPRLIFTTDSQQDRAFDELLTYENP